MLKNLLSKKGQSIPLAMAAVGLVVAGGIMFIQNATQKLAVVQQTTSDWKLDLMSKKALMLGSYLVSNSLVLCKEEAFSSNKNCTWSGDFLKPIIPVENFGLIVAKASDSEKKSLTFYVDLVDAALKESLPDGKKIIISFDLVNTEKNKDLASYMGQVSDEVKKVDDDKFLVLLKVRVPYKDGAGAFGGYFETFAAIKRPLAIPKLEIKVARPCFGGCPSSVGENPFPECRGPQETPMEATSAYALTFTNTGPGAIYKADYQRKLKFTPLTPGRKEEFKAVNFLAGKDFIMPNEKFEFSDSITCFEPKIIYKTVYASATTSCSSCAGTYSSTTLNQHLQTMASVEYSLTPGTRLLGNKYMKMEPNKSTMTLESPDGTIQQLVKEYTTTITTVRYVSPH